MTQYTSVAGIVSEGLETIGERLEQSGQPLKGRLLKNPAVRKQLSTMVGNHPWLAVGLALAGISAYFYFRD